MLGTETVAAALKDVDTAPIPEPLRATLRLLATVTLSPDGSPSCTADDIRPLLAQGLTRAHIESALDVAFCFNVITRLADTFEFHVGPDEMFAASAKMLLKRGYKL